MNEDPNKMRISRRDLVVGAVTTAAASAIPQLMTAKETNDVVSNIPMEEWKPITLKGGQTVQVTGIQHEPDSFISNFKGIHDRIKNSKLVILEGSGLVGTDVAEITGAMAQDKKFLERPDLLMRIIQDDGRFTDFGAFYGAIAGTAMLEGKRVFEIEPLYGIPSELLDNIISAVGTLHILSKTSQKAPHQLYRNASAISVLSNLKERLAEGALRAGAQGAHDKLLQFDNKEILRFAWNLSDWRDLRCAMAIKNLPARIPEYWRSREVAQIFRGSDHGPGLTHYLKTTVEPEAKRLTYPHWEIMAAITGSAPREDVREITKAGAQAIS